MFLRISLFAAFQYLRRLVCFFKKFHLLVCVKLTLDVVIHRFWLETEVAFYQGYLESPETGEYLPSQSQSRSQGSLLPV